MTTSSEDVLLQMGEVRFKKGDGTLYVMNERLAWMAEHRDTVAVSHRFQDIKMQKISPEGKPKVQLQVVLHDGNSSTFHFVNRVGIAAQISDRDKVKELLQQLLPNFKRKVDKELEEKNRLLSENPTLLQLYKDLVITQVITSEEFWLKHARHYAQGLNNTKKQDIGVSGAFLADIKPQTDGCNGLKYNLTSDIIECIFKTYPAVKRKHTEYVPAKLTESEFWTKFFQSHYFHRDRINTGNKDIFTECGKIDDQMLKHDVEKNSNDPLLDLKSFDDSPVDECYGTAENTQNDKHVVNSGNIVHQSMIKRFNQHSIMVLKTCTVSAQPTVTQPDSKSEKSSNKLDNSVNNSETSALKDHNLNSLSTTTTNGSPGKHKHSLNTEAAVNDGNDVDLQSPGYKKARILDKIQYEELIAESSIMTNSPRLNLTKVERYLHGPVPISTNATNNDSSNDLDFVQEQIIRDTELWGARTPHKVLVSATAAVNALGELSPGGALMRGFQEQSLAQLVPQEVEKELRHLYLSLLELLRHFWRSFPPTTSELELTAVKMHEALQRYQAVKLKPFEDRALRELAPIGPSLTQHINQLLQAASRKFITWQERKMRIQR